MTAPKKAAAEAPAPAVTPADADPGMTQPSTGTADVTASVVKPAVGVSPEEAFEMTKAPTPVNPPISIGAPGEPTPDQRIAAEKRATADGVIPGDRSLASDAMLRALEIERDGYLSRGEKDRAAQVDADIKARKDAARKAAPAGRTTERKSTT